MNVAWSYSALNSFETCPKKHYHTKVKKDIPDPPGESAKWGTEVHKFLEERIKDGKQLPDSVKQYEPLCSKIEASPGNVMAESQYCLNAGYKSVSWFAKDAWVRCILDLAVINDKTALVLDWKTGKRKPGSDQLKLFAATVFALEPGVEKVSTGFVWLKENKIDKETYTRDQLPQLWKEFLPRVRRLEIAHEENKWEAKPSGLCRKYCPVKSCTFHGK